MALKMSSVQPAILVLTVSYVSNAPTSDAETQKMQAAKKFTAVIDEESQFQKHLKTNYKTSQ